MENNKQKIVTLFDILVAVDIKLYDFSAILCNIFEIHETYLFIADNYEDLLVKDMNEIKVFCLVSPINGDFLWLLTLYIYDRDLLSYAPDVAQKISTELNSSCITPDEDTDNPYAYLAFYPSQKHEKVTLNLEKSTDDVYIVNRHAKMGH